MCDHQWAFQHVVYWSGSTMPGSGARERHYADKYFCQKCLAVKYANERIHGNDYSKPEPGTFPR